MKAIIKDWFGNKAEKSEVSSLIFGFLGIIFIAVGFIEVISILFKPVSLTFVFSVMFLVVRVFCTVCFI